MISNNQKFYSVELVAEKLRRHELESECGRLRIISKKENKSFFTSVISTNEKSLNPFRFTLVTRITSKNSLLLFFSKTEAIAIDSVQQVFEKSQYSSY